MNEPAKHTPGPWTTERGTSVLGVGEEYEVVADGGAVVIACPPSEADARLISAAPELLAALETLVALAPAFRAGKVGAEGSAARAASSAATCAYCSARAAIAKAKGTA